MHSGLWLLSQRSLEADDRREDDVLQALGDCLDLFAAKQVAREHATQEKAPLPVEDAAKPEEPQRQLLAGFDKLQTCIVRCMVDSLSLTSLLRRTSSNSPLAQW